MSSRRPKGKETWVGEARDGALLVLRTTAPRTLQSRSEDGRHVTGQCGVGNACLDLYCPSLPLLCRLETSPPSPQSKNIANSDIAEPLVSSRCRPSTPSGGAGRSQRKPAAFSPNHPVAWSGSLLSFSIPKTSPIMLCLSLLEWSM